MKRKNILFIILCLTILSFALGKGEAAYYDWTVETVDSPGTVGDEGTSIGFDSSDNPSISYYLWGADDPNRNLKFATKSGGSWNIQTVDSVNNVGRQSSMTFNGSGNPIISYLDFTNMDLKFIEHNGTTWNAPVSLDSADAVGTASSIASFGNKIAITYYDNTNTNINFIEYDGASWQTPEILATSGFSSSVIYDSSGDVHVSYGTSDTYDLIHATKSGGVWSTESVDTGGSVGTESSMLIYGGYPGISYKDATNQSLKFAQKGIGGWTVETIDGLDGDTSLTYDAAGNPLIAYAKYSGGSTNLKFARKVNGSWILETVDNSLLYTGTDNSIDVDSSGNLGISYYDSTLDDLKFAFGKLRNLYDGANNDIDAFLGLTEKGADQTGGVTADSIPVTGNGKIVQSSYVGTEEDFLVSSLVGDVFSMMDLSLIDSTQTGTATLTFNYGTTEILNQLTALGINEEELLVFRLIGAGNIEQLPSVSIDTAANTLTVTTTGFSGFAIGINPEPASFLLLISALFGFLPFRKKF